MPATAPGCTKAASLNGKLRFIYLYSYIYIFISTTSAPGTRCHEAHDRGLYVHAWTSRTFLFIFFWGGGVDMERRIQIDGIMSVKGVGEGATEGRGK